jgi:isopenicillin N synthase-like dioxygenase
MLREFFALPAETKQQFTVPDSHGQTGYTGRARRDRGVERLPDWKEMLNWASPIPSGHPLRRKFPVAYPDQVLPEAAVPGITDVLYRFHEAIADLQRRFLRVIAEGIGCHESFFDDMVLDGPTLTRAIRYPPMDEVAGAGHVWAGAHGDINLITALPRATAPGLQVLVDDEWVDAAPPDGQVIINTGIMLERLTNGTIPIGWHRVVAAPGYEGERTASSSSATRARGRCCRRCRAAARPSTRSASARSPPPTRSTRCSTRSTWSRTPAGSPTDESTEAGGQTPTMIGVRGSLLSDPVTQ